MTTTNKTQTLEELEKNVDQLKKEIKLLFDLITGIEKKNNRKFQALQKWSNTITNITLKK